MKIWVTGSHGMLGKALIEHCRRLGIDASGASRNEADISQLSELHRIASDVRPTHIVNCAAYTNVDGAEKEKEAAYAANALGAAHIATVAKDLGARLVHISTDYVFNGTGSVPYKETDVCQPANCYGLTKWEGEKHILNIFPQACIVRTSWLFGLGGKNFISSLMKWLQEKEEIQVVSDQCGRPTYCYDLADAILSLLDAEGIVHFANTGERSRYQIALDLMSEMKERNVPMKCKQIIPVPSTQFPTPAVRPAYSVLDTLKYTELTGREPRAWDEIVKEYVHAL